jgi:hypothetical protein
MNWMIAYMVIGSCLGMSYMVGRTFKRQQSAKHQHVLKVKSIQHYEALNPPHTAVLLICECGSPLSIRSKLFAGIWTLGELGARDLDAEKLQRMLDQT